jgi:hypothetical protein
MGMFITMTKISVYLAGAMDDNTWRHKVVKECQDLPIEWMSPVSGHNSVFHLADKWKVDHADIIFAFIRRWSTSTFSGTSWECGRANGKIVILVDEMRKGGYELLGAMVDVHCLVLDTGIERLRELVGLLTYDITREDQ